MFRYQSAISEIGNFDLEVFLLYKASAKKISKSTNILPRIISQIVITSDFAGELKETHIFYQRSKEKLTRVLILGMGDPEELDAEKLRELGYAAGRKAFTLKTKKVLIYVNSINLNMVTSVGALTDGFLYSGYSFDKYKSTKSDKKIKPKVTFVGPDEYSDQLSSGFFAKFEAIHSGIDMARNLANEPSNKLTPSILKKQVESFFKNTRNITFNSFDKKELIKRKMNGILSVAKGSVEDPFMIKIHYKPKKSTSKKIVLVGKGVTFDSGGISIKPSSQMDEMKFDMAGAAAVIGILKSVSLLQPDFEIIGIIPAVENMPGHKALKPGDIIKTYNGKTVEIINTDAEGRLILADALAYGVEKYKPDIIVDFATLTGAVEVALGDKMAGMFTKSKSLADILFNSGEATGDRVWLLPLLDSYAKDMESKIADIKNLGGRWGGAVTAAKFLENFVSDANWVHLDIAGVAFDVKNIAYLTDDATGFGVRLFINALDHLAESV